MQPNQTIELKIIDLGMEGEGIAKYEGYTFFVPYALPGEIVKAKITHIKKGKNLGYAELKEIVEISPHRVKPPCNRFTRCGGCTMMHLDYKTQLEYKKKNLQNILRKNAGYVGEVADVVPSLPMAYRNKAQLPFGTVNGRVAVGFYGTGTHKIVSSTKCFLHGEWLEKLIAIVLNFANENKITAYNEETRSGLLRHLVARYICGQMVVTLVINGTSIPNVESLIAELENEFGKIALYLSPNTRDTNVIMGDTLIPVHPTPLEIEVMGVKVEINPFSFFQINDYIREKLYNRVIETVAPDENTVVIDAYAGVGLMGAIMAKRGAMVFNIEIVKEATADSIQLYKTNGVENKAVNICGDAAIELKKLVTEAANEDVSSQTALFRKLVAEGKKVKIILDPPRKGISKEVADALNTLSESLDFELIYISCNPATLSRDIACLTAFEPTEIAPYDMFPHTSHVETLVCFKKR